MKLEIDELELLLGPEDSEVNLRYILRNASRRAGFLKSSIRKRKVSTWSQAKCDGMSVRDRGWRRKKEQGGMCKKLTMRSITIGQRPVNGLQENVEGFGG